MSSVSHCQVPVISTVSWLVVDGTVVLLTSIQIIKMFAMRIGSPTTRSRAFFDGLFVGEASCLLPL